MKANQKTSAKAVALLFGAALALTACGASGDEAPDAETTAASQSPSVPNSNIRRVQVQKIIDGETLSVTAVSEDDPMYEQEFTVHLVGLDSPVKGDCGFKEANAHAEDYFSPGKAKFALHYSQQDGIEPISDTGVHRGNLAIGSSSYNPVAEGFATPNKESLNLDYDKQMAKEAKADQRGLYKTCPDFGN